MPPWFENLITVIVAVLASSGFWTYIQSRSNHKDLKSQMLIGLAHDRVVHLGMTYCERGYITNDEYENLYEYLYKPYRDLGGNGTAKKIMEEVAKLPMYRTHIQAKEALGHETVEHDV